MPPNLCVFPLIQGILEIIKMINSHYLIYRPHSHLANYLSSIFYTSGEVVVGFFPVTFPDPIQDHMLHDLDIFEDDQVGAPLTFPLIGFRLCIVGRHTTEVMMGPPPRIVSGSI